MKFLRTIFRASPAEPAALQPTVSIQTLYQFPFFRFGGSPAEFCVWCGRCRSGPSLAYADEMSLAVQTSAILAARGNLTICVVDADQTQMAITRDCLSRAGFPAIGTVSSQDAFERSRIGRCRVILADCKLPGTDGVAFLDQALRQDPRMHVILMSAAHSVDSAIEAIKHGAYDYLCRPLDYPRLMKTLDDLAEQLRKLQGVAVTLNGDWRPLPLSEMRSMHIQRVLETCHGNRVRAARMLGIGRTSLYRFLKSADKQATVQAGA